MYKLITAMKALPDEIRLRILNLLLERECCVYEVMQAPDISQSRNRRLQLR
jgi:ArsR family transcriptional regulator